MANPVYIRIPRSISMSAFLFAVAAMLVASQVAGAKIFSRERHSNGTLAQVLWIGGEDRSWQPGGLGALSSSICAADDDVLACAGKMRDFFKVPTNGFTDQRALKQPGLYSSGTKYNNYPIDWVFKYSVQVSNCSLSNPRILDRQPLFFCNTKGTIPECFSIMANLCLLL